MPEQDFFDQAQRDVERLAAEAGVPPDLLEGPRSAEEFERVREAELPEPLRMRESFRAAFEAYDRAYRLATAFEGVSDVQEGQGQGQGAGEGQGEGPDRVVGDDGEGQGQEAAEEAVAPDWLLRSRAHAGFGPAAGGRGGGWAPGAFGAVGSAGDPVPAQASRLSVYDLRTGAREASDTVPGSAVGPDLPEVRDEGSVSGDAASKRYRRVFMARREMGNIKGLMNVVQAKFELVDSLLEKALASGPDVADGDD